MKPKSEDEILNTPSIELCKSILYAFSKGKSILLQFADSLNSSLIRVEEFVKKKIAQNHIFGLRRNCNFKIKSFIREFLQDSFSRIIPYYSKRA